MNKKSTPSNYIYCIYILDIVIKAYNPKKSSRGNKTTQKLYQTVTGFQNRNLYEKATPTSPPDYMNSRIINHSESENILFGHHYQRKTPIEHYNTMIIQNSASGCCTPQANILQTIKNRKASLGFKYNFKPISRQQINKNNFEYVKYNKKNSTGRKDGANMREKGKLLSKTLYFKSMALQPKIRVYPNKEIRSDKEILVKAKDHYSSSIPTVKYILVYIINLRRCILLTYIFISD